MKDNDDDVIDHITKDLENIQDDWDELTDEAIEKDMETLKRFADDISQLGEDAQEAETVYEIKEDAQNIIKLLNAPLWGNVSLLYAADTFDDINPRDSLFCDLIKEFVKHPEQYQQLFGEFETLIRRFRKRS